MYKDKFVLSIIHENYPVRETGHFSNREVAIPFGSEYKIRLKNKNDRSCTARVFIDGKKVSSKGDVVIYAGGSIDLERFIDRSLSEGKRFKFVSLDHPNVDDPTSGENGLIKVEFRLAKQLNGIEIGSFNSTYNNIGGKNRFDNSGIRWVINDDTGSLMSSRFTGDASPTYNYTCNYVSRSSDIEQGATVEGSQSYQNFGTINLDVEDRPAAVLILKIVGINELQSVERFDKKLHKLFCSYCGARLKKEARYCSECGSKV